MAKKTPAEIKQGISKLMDQKQTADSRVADLVRQAKQSIQSSLSALFTNLMRADLPSAKFQFVKHRVSKRWTIQASFDESELKGRPDVVQALADVAAYADSAGLKDSISEEVT